jgi:OOP family OmpA-OmpF porin
MHRSRLALIPGILAALSLLLAACGDSTAASASPSDEASEAASPSATEAAAATPEATEEEAGPAGDSTVSLSGGQFSPRSLTIAVGSTVTFTNTGGHTVTEGSSGTAAADPIVDAAGGSDVEVTFDEPGTYSFTCKIHPNMNMTISVQD